MNEFLSENLATIIICAILICVVTLIIWKMIKDKKAGKTSCGCGCSNCPSSTICHEKKH